MEKAALMYAMRVHTQRSKSATDTGTVLLRAACREWVTGKMHRQAVSTCLLAFILN
jgi:hypothetical protein